MARLPTASLALLDKWIATLLSIFESVGGLTLLGAHVLRWLQRSLILRQIRFGFPAAVAQMNRVGVRSIGIVGLVSGSIGIILALQTSPSLATFGQIDKWPT